MTHIRDVLIKIGLYVPPLDAGCISFVLVFLPEDNTLLLDLGVLLFEEGPDGVVVFGGHFFGGWVQLDGRVVEGYVLYLNAVVRRVQIFEVAGSILPYFAFFPILAGP